ncbi:hypothetical protein V493_00346 [Pseudogymnoascus sp. VKM F-4281 (FW-2241)]|nr:hypothetical protein V493_00346 [Pseudogymnoascus sp. VKM F-4281 (FW-2241)]
MLDVRVPPPLGVVPGDREQLALMQRLARSDMDQDQQPLQELFYYSLVLVNGFLAPSLRPVISGIQKGAPQWLRRLNRRQQGRRRPLE